MAELANLGYPSATAMTTDPNQSSSTPSPFGEPLPNQDDVHRQYRAALGLPADQPSSAPIIRNPIFNDEPDDEGDDDDDPQPGSDHEPRIVDLSMMTMPISYQPETLIPASIVSTPAVQHALTIMRLRHRHDNEHRSASPTDQHPRQGEPWHEPEANLFRLLIATLGPVGSRWSTFTGIHGRSKDAIKRQLSNNGWLSSSGAAHVLGDDTLAGLADRILPAPTVDQWRAASQLPPLQVRNPDPSDPST